MPQNDCERWFCHVMAFAPFIWNAPKSKNFIFGSFSVSYLILKKGKMGHFKYFEHRKVGHFGFFARDHFENRKGTENEIIRFWGISNKWGKCHHMTKSSFTSVLGHFILPPVFLQNCAWKSLRVVNIPICDRIANHMLWNRWCSWNGILRIHE